MCIRDRIEMHAIGDKAFVQAVRAIKAALDDLPREDHRHTIIHACLPTAEEIAVCERYHINLAVQTAFIEMCIRDRTSTIEPILNPILVAVFYGETIGATAVIGALLVVGSATVYNVRQAKNAA